jgi:hypothetical protein
MGDELARQFGGAERATVPLPVAAAVGEMERVIVGLRARFVDAAAIPRTPTVRRRGPGRLLLAAGGALAGFAIWLAYLHLVLRRSALPARLDGVKPRVGKAVGRLVEQA